MIGAIKIKDGLFIGDELAGQVSTRVRTNSRIWNSLLLIKLLTSSIVQEGKFQIIGSPLE
jgi:hypothetical protein